MEGVKTCSMCGEEKPLSAFHKNAAGTLGLTARCKACASIVYAQYRSDNREKELARKRKYNREHKIERAQYKRENYTGITQGTRDSLKRWKNENRQKLLAHKKVYNAVKRGTLVKMPCEICGTTLKIHAHHENYDTPLDVVWLCQKHHRWIHS